MRKKSLLCFVISLSVFASNIALANGQITLSDGQVQIENISIQSKTIADNSSVHTSIKVGDITNRSHGGHSGIHIGTLNSGANSCEFNNSSNNKLEITRVISNDQNINIQNTTLFDLCVSGTNNKINIQESSKISRLLVLGSNNDIRIIKGAKVNKVHLNGKHNVIYTPESETFNIVDLGEGNAIIEN